ncbi:MAG: hypothetical protein DRO10_02080 [Thermoprotei archaeon]|nr:MAG: hypothetical protein DRO10_02080 [Thermoprotei archaeon]
MARLVKSFFGYIYLEANVDEAVKVLEAMKELGRETGDVEDSLRILRNFDAFQEMLRKRFKEFIAPRKSERDLIMGRVSVDKLRLIRKGGERKVVIVFDKRVPEDDVVEALQKAGVEFERAEE